MFRRRLLDECHCAQKIPNLYKPIVAEVIVFLTMKDVANSMNIDQRDPALKGSAECSETLSDTLGNSVLIGQSIKELRRFMSA